MSLKGLRHRTLVVQSIRHYLASHGFEEIEPQLLAPADTLEPTIYPFKIDNHYLSTSPEAFLKQAMAAGLGNCFAISHAFRNLEGRSNIHNPEFIMAEWYQQNADYHHMIRFTQNLVSSVLSLPSANWPVYSWRDLWQQAFNLPLDQLLDDPAMADFARQQGCNPQSATWEQLFNQLADIKIVSSFSHQPFFLIDYPARISPLAKSRPDLPAYAERFELYFNGMELANGNTELFDTAAIIPTLKTEQHHRGGLLYQDFLCALDKLNHQTWAGVGLGIDRLAMLLGQIEDINQVQTVSA